MPTNEETAAEEAEASFDAAAAQINEDASLKKPGGYFPASTEPDTWDVRGRAIRLDICILSLRLLAFKVATRTYPTLTNSKLRNLRDSVVKFTAVRIAEWTGRQVIKEIASWLTFTLQLFDSVKAQKELEQTIRAQSLVIMRQWHGLGLPHRKGRQQRKVVATRHIKHGR